MVERTNGEEGNLEMESVKREEREREREKKEERERERERDKGLSNRSLIFSLGCV